jgi:damage-control phosphatase, subfamily I
MVLLYLEKQQGGVLLKVQVDCVHCYLKQVVSTMKRIGLEDKLQYEILYKLMDEIKNLDNSNTPAYNSSIILEKAYDMLGDSDPYLSAKKDSNDIALSFYPELKERLANSKERLHDAVKMSVAGNVIDLGIYRDFNIDSALAQVMEEGFSVDCFSLFESELSKTDRVIIIGDNAGEIVFDKILIEELVRIGKSVTYVVKSKPVLNDATMDDAEYVGLRDIANVIETGSGHLGVSLADISDEFRYELENASLIVSKGQANFESLEDVDWISRKAFFLLKIKCEEVARVSGLEFNSMVFLRKSN